MVYILLKIKNAVLYSIKTDDFGMTYSPELQPNLFPEYTEFHSARRFSGSI